MESFFKTLKVELIHPQRYCVFRESVTGVFGNVTGGFWNVTGHFGDVTDGPTRVS